MTLPYDQWVAEHGTKITEQFKSTIAQDHTLENESESIETHLKQLYNGYVNLSKIHASRPQTPQN